MKRSVKLLVIFGVVLLAAFILLLYLARIEADRTVAQYRRDRNLKVIETSKFENLVFGPGMNINVIGTLGTSISVQEIGGVAPEMRNADGTLYFEVKDYRGGPLYDVNVRLMDIKSIKASRGSLVYLFDLDIDSLSVELPDRRSLTISDCKIQHMVVHTADGLTEERAVMGE